MAIMSITQIDSKTEARLIYIKSSISELEMMSHANIFGLGFLCVIVFQSFIGVDGMLEGSGDEFNEFRNYSIHKDSKLSFVMST